MADGSLTVRFGRPLGRTGLNSAEDKRDELPSAMDEAARCGSIRTGDCDALDRLTIGLA